MEMDTPHNSSATMVSPDLVSAKRQLVMPTTSRKQSGFAEDEKEDGFGNEGGRERKKSKQCDAVLLERDRTYSMKLEIVPQGTSPVNLRSSHPELFVESLLGNIDIIWCNDGNREGFIDPLMKALFSPDKRDIKALKIMEELKRNTHIFAATGRRVSPTENQVQMKQGNNGAMYKLTYLIRRRIETGQVEEREQRKCLEYMAEVMFSYTERRIRERMLSCFQ